MQGRPAQSPSNGRFCCQLGGRGEFEREVEREKTRRMREEETDYDEAKAAQAANPWRSRRRWRSVGTQKAERVPLAQSRPDSNVESGLPSSQVSSKPGVEPMQRQTPQVPVQSPPMPPAETGAEGAGVAALNQVVPPPIPPALLRRPDPKMGPDLPALLPPIPPFIQPWLDATPPWATEMQVGPVDQGQRPP